MKHYGQVKGRRFDAEPSVKRKQCDEKRVCRVCGELKPVGEFVKRPDCPGGRGKLCKQCDSERNKQYRREHARNDSNN